jgi:hypothetical protein
VPGAAQLGAPLFANLIPDFWRIKNRIDRCLPAAVVRRLIIVDRLAQQTLGLARLRNSFFNQCRHRHHLLDSFARVLLDQNPRLLQGPVAIGKLLSNRRRQLAVGNGALERPPLARNPLMTATSDLLKAPLPMPMWNCAP